MKKLHTATTRLEKRVQSIVNRHAEDYDNGVNGFLSDLNYGGCQSGLVGELIYYRDTLKWYKLYKSEINDLLKESIEETGIDNLSELFGDKWDKEDPLAHDTMNQNLLAWFSFEETANRLASKAEIEI